MGAPLTGHCLCGNVSYAISEEHQGAAVCHYLFCSCNDCRRGTGSAFSVTVTVPRASLSIEGEYKTYETRTDEGKSASHVFCPNCGSHIANLPGSDARVAWVKAGTLADDHQKELEPAVEVFTRSRLPFVTQRFGTQFESMPGAA